VTTSLPTISGRDRDPGPAALLVISHLTPGPASKVPEYPLDLPAAKLRRARSTAAVPSRIARTTSLRQPSVAVPSRSRSFLLLSSTASSRAARPPCEGRTDRCAGGQRHGVAGDRRGAVPRPRSSPASPTLPRSPRVAESQPTGRFRTGSAHKCARPGSEPRRSLPATKPNPVPDVELSMGRLGALTDGTAARDALLPLVAAYRDWIEARSEEAARLPDETS